MSQRCLLQHLTALEQKYAYKLLPFEHFYVICIFCTHSWFCDQVVIIVQVHVFGLDCFDLMEVLE